MKELPKNLPLMSCSELEALQNEFTHLMENTLDPKQRWHYYDLRNVVSSQLHREKMRQDRKDIDRAKQNIREGK